MIKLIDEGRRLRPRTSKRVKPEMSIRPTPFITAWHSAATGSNQVVWRKLGRCSNAGSSGRKYWARSQPLIGAKLGAPGFQDRVKSIRPGRPPRGPMFVGVVEAEFVLVFLDRLGCGEAGVGVGGEAAGVEGPCVPFGLAVER